jgi:hypothetical protein
MLAPELLNEVSIDRDSKQKPGAGFRPGTVREFQFPECTDLRGGVKRENRRPHGVRRLTRRGNPANND